MTTTEKIVTATALFISLLALFVSIKQTNIMRDQKQASVWPYVQIGMSWGLDRYEIDVTNSGVGPAKITEMYYTLQDTTGDRSKDTVFAKINELIIYIARQEKWSRLSMEYANLESGTEVMTAGESRNILLVEDDSVRQHTAIVREYFQRVSPYIQFCSIYDECWVNENGEIRLD